MRRVPCQTSPRSHNTELGTRSVGQSRRYSRLCTSVRLLLQHWNAWLWLADLSESGQSDVKEIGRPFCRWAAFRSSCIGGVLPRRIIPHFKCRGLGKCNDSSLANAFSWCTDNFSLSWQPRFSRHLVRMYPRIEIPSIKIKITRPGFKLPYSTYWYQVAVVPRDVSRAVLIARGEQGEQGRLGLVPLCVTISNTADRQMPQNI